MSAISFAPTPAQLARHYVADYPGPVPIWRHWDKPDWVGMFAPARDEFDRDDELHASWLPPRMAYAMHAAACVQADLWELHDAESMAMYLPPVAQELARASRSWREALMLAAMRLACRLELGPSPCPNCTAEEAVLHLVIGNAQDSAQHWLLDTDEVCQALPGDGEELDFDLVRDCAFQDHDAAAARRGARCQGCARCQPSTRPQRATAPTA